LNKIPFKPTSESQHRSAGYDLFNGSSNFREDINLDGLIDSADIAFVKSKSGTALPASGGVHTPAPPANIAPLDDESVKQRGAYTVRYSCRGGII